MNKRILVILKGFPRISETFILQELLALEASGLDLVIYSLKGPREEVTHVDVAKLKAQIFYQDPDLPHDAPEQVELCVKRVKEVDLIYSHFLHSPTQFAQAVAFKIQRPLVSSGHAVDIYTTSNEQLKKVISACKKVFVCHRHGYETLQKLAGEESDKVAFLPHGVDTKVFCTTKKERESQHYLSVGRLVPKKGYEIILRALARFKSERPNFRYSIIGEGDLRASLVALTKELGLEQQVQFLGAQTRSQTLELLKRCSLFIMAPKVCENGDRDGIPNVLLEAMACEIPVLSRQLAGLEEILIPGETAQVFHGDDDQLVIALKDFERENSQQRSSRASLARRLVSTQFDSESHLKNLIDHLRQELS